jgi:hypothetical protein
LREQLAKEAARAAELLIENGRLCDDLPERSAKRNPADHG